MNQQYPDSPLESIRRKQVGLRDDVTSVAHGYLSGLFAWGPPGTGKSWTVRSQLRDMKVAWRETPGTMTAKALFTHLRRFPDDVTLIEDQESLLKDKTALNLLRAALWTTDRDNRGRIPERAVHWSTGPRQEELLFGGGLIIVQNAAPPQTIEVQAVLSRVITKHLTASTDEVIALMRELAATAPPNIMNYAMKPAECTEVAEFLIQASLSRGQVLNLRLLDISYRFYVQHQVGDSAQDWRDRVLALIQGRDSKSPLHAVDMSGATRRDRQERDREVVRAILSETTDAKEQVRLWGERTGKGQSMFYERKKEVERLK